MPAGNLEKIEGGENPHMKANWGLVLIPPLIVSMVLLVVPQAMFLRASFFPFCHDFPRTVSRRLGGVG